MSLVSSLRGSKRKVQAPWDPWRLPFEGLRGKTWEGGVGRISTLTVFGIPEVLSRTHTTGACRRLPKLMREPSWHPHEQRPAGAPVANVHAVGMTGD